VVSGVLWLLFSREEQELIFGLVTLIVILVVIAIVIVIVIVIVMMLAMGLGAPMIRFLAGVVV
jgi:uncharacterized membrane protein